MTIHQIWEEYRQEQPDGYSYSQFCYHFQVWRDGDEVTMHIEHKVGDKLFVDLCVQQRLARSAGDRPAGVRARAP